MKYTKPEVAVLGQATAVIERSTNKLHPIVPDATAKAPTPAYDLDE